MGIVLGAIAFLLFPIFLGPAGVILAVVGMVIKEKLAPVALTVATIGTIVGMILGYIVWSTY